MQRSNTYIILFSIALTVVLGGLLSLASVGLKPAQQKQIELDTKKKILGAVMDISSYEDPNALLALYDEKVESIVVDIEGNLVETDEKGNPIVAEKVNIQKNYRFDPEERVYPVYKFKGEGGKVDAYIFPMFGAGLWDWISGYLALDKDLNTIRGVAFDHKQETPGLGARITTDVIQGRYVGKEIFNDQNELVSVSMVKGEGNPGLTEHQVDGMSGATLTGKGVNEMFENYLGAYLAYINKVKSDNKLALK
ncbi:NADH:ubiquinone reductase (Na(+)-transporting) subunit C [Marinoscillum furvescens]|uniref:Na(+)-translocating NADH-quinone reductase subunit C n=1 Tax=Marinoscillum furvescens DSM 4134 TaxID=1122208 RepID=A0A3D9L095_MARFU|nr:NADH:ubiquinone reductase (Na(+)-transporting) subunit C [Marinoscillum furvescens]RED93192.1 Na+-transporting NADH:ubiquinone oxidoreductase subunit C [Marinoscillum furvescens DSM 4134]